MSINYLHQNKAFRKNLTYKPVFLDFLFDFSSLSSTSTVLIVYQNNLMSSTVSIAPTAIVVSIVALDPTISIKNSA